MGDSSARRRIVRMAKMICALLMLGAIVSASALPSSDQVVPEDALVSYDDPYWMSGEYQYKEVEQGADIYSLTKDNKREYVTNRESNKASWAMVKPGTECGGAETPITTGDFTGARKAAASKCNAACTGISQNFILSSDFTGSSKKRKCYCEDKNNRQRLTEDGDCDDTTYNSYNLYKKSDAWVLETKNSECGGGDEEFKGQMSLDMCAAACTSLKKPYRGFIFGKTADKCLTGSSRPTGTPPRGWCNCYCELQDSSTCEAVVTHKYDTYKFVKVGKDSSGPVKVKRDKVKRDRRLD